jgi:hypothetical protein
MDRSELDKHWTFNDEMIVGMLAMKAKIEIEAAVKYETDRNAKYGLQRKPVEDEPPAPAKVEPQPSGTVKSKPRASMGSGQRPAKVLSGEDQIASMASDLGLE